MKPPSDKAQKAGQAETGGGASGSAAASYEPGRSAHESNQPGEGDAKTAAAGLLRLVSSPGRKGFK